MSLLSYAKCDIKSMDSIPVYSLHHEQRDTINFKNRMLQNDRKLIVYCANWCYLSYKEFNLLYSQEIIDKLLDKGFHLIIVAGQYPFLKLNHHLIEGNWNERVMEDFEIYFDVDGKTLNAISGESSFPHLIVMNKSDILVESHGLKENYSFIVDAIKVLNICPVCNGTGRVKPQPRSGDTDLSVGICRRCGGKGKF